MKKVWILCLLLGGFCSTALAQTPIEEYTFWDTVRYSNGSFTSTETVFMDLNEDDQIVGYYLNAANSYVGFVYDLKKNAYHTYSQPGYTHTQITGINTFGELLGKCYNSVTAARAFRGEFINDSIQNVQLIGWGGTTTAPNQEPRRLNSNGVGAGSVRSGATATNRWITYENIFPPLTVSGIKRVELSSTPYNTYGLGINNANEVSGWYLNGLSYRPVVFYHSSNSFSYFNQKILGANSRTIFNDINDNGFVAVEYRDGSGFWQGSIAELTGSFASYESDANFIFSPAKTPNGSSIQGLNNSNDIVGYVVTPTGDKVAFFAVTDAYGMEHPDMDEIGGVYQIVNNNTYFDYDSLQYDYMFDDIWLNQPDSFLINYIAPIYFGDTSLPAISGHQFDNGLVYPSWNAFVYAQDQDSCYITTNSVLKPKFSAIHNWLSKSDGTFQGNCFGMSAFALQHFKDSNVLNNRFNNIANNSDINSYDSLSTGMNLPLIETMSALQLYQYDSDQYPYWDTMSAFVNNYSISSNAVLNHHERVASDILAHSILDADNARIMSWQITATNNNVGYHAVVPIGVKREFVLDDPRDSIFIIDPNYPNEFPVVVFDPNNTSLTSYPASAFPEVLDFFIADAALNELDIASPAKVASRPAGNAAISSNSSYKTIGGSSIFYSKNACDYVIEDNTNPANQYIKAGALLTNNFPGLVARYTYDSYLPPNSLVTNSSLDTKTSLTACNRDLQWALSYPKGEMIFGRRAAQPTETDVIYNHNDVIRAENPDAIDKYIKLAANYGPGNSESFVSIDSFKLEQNDSLRYESLDQYNFKLSNGKNTPNSYNLFVRYLSPSEYFIWKTKKINITPNTDHIIQLRPTSPIQKVVILIDSLQDGTIDDSIAITNGGLSNSFIVAENHNIQVYPNPTQDKFSVQMNKLPQGGYDFMIYNQLGQLVRTKKLQPTASGTLHAAFDLSDLQKGVYFLNVRNPATGFAYQRKIILK